MWKLRVISTKSKNSKKFSLVIAGTLIILAAVIFMAFYPVFDRKAAQYDEDILQSDSFLEHGRLYLPDRKTETGRAHV